MAYVGVLCDYYRTKSNNNGYGYTGSITGDFDWNEVQVGAEAGVHFFRAPVGAQKWGAGGCCGKKCRWAAKAGCPDVWRESREGWQV